MDPSNNPIWKINSTLPERVVNDGSDFTRYNASDHVHYPGCVLFSAVVLGLPGNLLVIAVYIANMKTSTRVYMFALAAADTAICICAVVLILAHTYTHFVATTVFISILSTTITFAVLLLVFMSVERLIAVRKPHTFNLNPKRAQLYLIVFLFCGVLFTTLNAFARHMKYEQFYRIAKASFLIASASVMATCYTVIGVTLLKTAVTSRNQITSINMEITSQNCNRSNVTLTCTNVHSDVTQSTSMNVTAKITAKQAKKFKSIFLLFLITVVFVACWLPTWIRTIGVNVSKDVTRVYVVNSIINPFIYGVASAMFREDVRQFYRQTRTKLSACYT
ncbi:hypothetical protein NP493_1444g02015 [Ridgeia piscesae]|uniref:G-protein coupled receptors family 1 profile domain-containing protein n=1 Tax=Ridgeia piscesae TaxID=27915 RepID=A0AAD9NCT3_RIDPI|nr:hypothetical protein NP493_1444g02015 [Ridgeia piscesae]